MGDHSNIQWTDATWNPTTGCTRVSAGCDHCYAFQLHDQRHEAWKAGRWPDAPAQYHRPFSDVQTISSRLVLPMRWTKPRRIFVDSMSDLFHRDVPDYFIARVFAVMASAKHHQFQVLTKRPQRMHRLLKDARFEDLIEQEAEILAGDLGWCHLNLPEPWPWPLPNVWLGTSVENQEAAYRLDWLIQTPSAVRFVSCEPLLGRLSLEPWLWLTGPSTAGPWRDAAGRRRGGGGIGGQMLSRMRANDLHLIIVGGESGPDFRPLNLDWARDLRDQCVEVGVPLFFKQVGGRTSKAGGRELDGRTWDELPAVSA